MTAVILYDEQCALCRSLAAFARRLSHQELDVEPWQKFSLTSRARELWEDPGQFSADQLRVIADSQVFEGVHAWEWLLLHHPALKQIGWLAERLGLSTVTAKALQHTTHRARRACPWCPSW